MRKKNKPKIIKTVKKIGICLIACAVLADISACKTSRLDGALANAVTDRTEQMTEETNCQEQPATEEYLDMTGGKQEDYSKYETDGTGSSETETAENSSNENSTQIQSNNVPVADPVAETASGDDTAADTENGLTCELTVTCATILDHMDKLAEGKESLIPSDGIIYSNASVTFEEGDTVFDVLQREMKNSSIQMEYTAAPAYASDYIEGINNLYEFDCGQESGWMYSVNGSYPNYGCSQYQLKDKDVVQWAYTCDLGKDIGKN